MLKYGLDDSENQAKAWVENFKRARPDDFILHEAAKLGRVDVIRWILQSALRVVPLQAKTEVDAETETETALLPSAATCLFSAERGSTRERESMGTNAERAAPAEQ